MHEHHHILGIQFKQPCFLMIVDISLSDFNYKQRTNKQQEGNNMGHFIAKLNFYVSGSNTRNEVRVIMLGLDGSGKTTILYQLRLGQLIITTPTIGFNVENIEYSNIKFTVWDIGGNDKLRPLWLHYFIYARAVIYVFDSSNKDRIQTAREELQKMLVEDELRDVALLVLANKQDLGVMNVQEAAENLGLHTLIGRYWHIQGTSAITGDGITEGFQWLRKIITSVS